MHHCTCIANLGRDGHARGLAAAGAGFISFQSNDIPRTQWAGVYLAQEDSYATYGTFDVSVLGNTIADANLGGSHDGLLAYSDSPTGSDPSATFGAVPHQIRRMTIQGNTISGYRCGDRQRLRHRDPRQRGHGGRQRQHARAQPDAADRHRRHELHAEQQHGAVNPSRRSGGDFLFAPGTDWHSRRDASPCVFMAIRPPPAGYDG